MILIATSLFPPEPVVSANISYDLAMVLSEDNEVAVISPKPTRPHGMRFKYIPHKNKFNHVILDSYTSSQSNIIGRLLESYSLGKHISKYIENNKDKIKVVYANVWPIFSQYALAKKCIEHKIPYIIHVQDIYPESLTNKLPFLGRTLYSLLIHLDKYTLLNAEKCISISEQMRNHLISTRKLKDSNVSVVRNWQNDDAFNGGTITTEDINIDEKYFNYVYLGSINPTAGVDLLINSFAKAKLDNSCLTIAGNGSDKDRCIKIARSHNCRINFIDARQSQVPYIQSKADILLLPLRKNIASTAFPSKLTAYMLSGKPIIATVEIESEIAQAIIKNNCGWISKPEDVDQLADLMKKVQSIPKEVLAKLGDNSLIFAKNNLSRKINLEKLTQIIKEA